MHVKEFSREDLDERFEALVVTERKPFVEPTVSVPVDVLQGTTYFQAVESGATG